MNEHTAGPWEVSEAPDPDGGYQIEGADCVVCSRAPWANRCDESRANARLIAAAPDLLEAAKAALEFLEANGMAHGRALAAAIAKAEGK